MARTATAALPGTAETRASRPARAAAILSPAEATREVTAWRLLAAMAADDNGVYGPDFLLPAIQHLVGSEVHLAVARNSGRQLTALAPVVRRRLGRIAPAVSVWTHAYGPLGTPLIDRAALHKATADLVGVMAEWGGPAAALVFPDLAEGPVADAVCAAAEELGRPALVLAGHARAALDRDIDGTDPRAGLQTRRRKEYARQLRRLGDLGPVVIELAPPDRTIAAMEEFLALEAAGWKGRQGTALAMSPATAALARDIAAAMGPSGGCRIAAIRLGGRPVAMLVCLLSGGTAITWKIAHDETLARFSPGAQLMLEAAPLLFAEPGVRRLDSFAAANHPMIDHLWPGRRRLATLVVEPARGRILFRAGLAAARAEAAARDTARMLRNRIKKRGATKGGNGHE